MDEQDLIKQRGDVIARAINVERIMDAVISCHYFGAVKISFLTEFLYDEYCSFGLKVNIVSKISKDKSLSQTLRRIASIRNSFAHTGLTFNEFVDKNDPTKGYKVRTPDPKKLHENMDYVSLYNEFVKLQNDAEDKLMVLFSSKGGTATPA